MGGWAYESALYDLCSSNEPDWKKKSLSNKGNIFLNDSIKVGLWTYFSQHVSFDSAAGNFLLKLDLCATFEHSFKECRCKWDFWEVLYYTRNTTLKMSGIKLDDTFDWLVIHSLFNKPTK